MSRPALETASDLLGSAADHAASDDDAERLSDLADRVASFASGDRGPDHGQLARIENALSELSESTSDESLGAIEDAHDHLKEYRSGVDGV
jgi:hypothetical protein